MTVVFDRLTSSLAGRYAIERELGAGGMATVYLALDVRHDRRVALKVLRPELAAVIGVERFLQEIKTTANLRHPHILSLYDSGEVAGTAFYVMPYVEGESLRDRLTRDRQLPIADAVRIATEVASALDYAHRHGVIHRDIKPENILLEEGSAALADFGIALAVNQAGGHRLTETGLSLGTPQYMSPEQATGERQLDARSDIYSIGAVLYESLAGEPPHSGPTSQAIIGKLLTEKPTRLRTLRPSVPEPLESAVNTALAKAPADRYRSAADFGAAIQAAAAGTTQHPRRLDLRRPIGATALLALFAAVGYWLVQRSGSTLPSIGRSQQFTADAGLEIQPALAPDGNLVAYAAGDATRMRIFIRPLRGGRTIPLSDDSASVETHPQWSPDGSQLLFLTRGGVSIGPALGGSSRPLIPPAGTRVVTTATWSPNAGQIAFVRSDSLLIVTVDGGNVEHVATGDDLHSCQWSPNRKWIACVSQNAIASRPGVQFGNLAPSAIVLFPVAGGEPTRIAEPNAVNQSPVFSGDGRRLLYVSNKDGPRDIYAIELRSSGQPQGEATRLTTGLGASSISMSANGQRLAYSVYTARANIWSLPVPASGTVRLEEATVLTTGNQVIESMRVSWDGRWLLYDSDLRGNADIYRIPLGGGTPEQLTSDAAEEFSPDLSPDGRAVVYHSWRSGTRDVEVKPLDGGPVERLTRTSGSESRPRWSPDGNSILFFDQVSFNVFIMRRDQNGVWSEPVIAAGPSAQLAEWSPDGRRIAYKVADAEGLQGPIHVLSLQGGKLIELFRPSASAPPADNMQWSNDGKIILYKAHDEFGRTSFWAVSALGGRPRLLARMTDPSRQSSRLDFASDGKRLYFAIEDRQSDVFVAELIAR